jgi:hypothetical protein
MTSRSPVAVFLLPLVTFGIYGLIWLVKTKDEMNAQGAEIPTAWLLILPVIQLYWMWKFAEGVGKTTREDMGGGLAFILILFTGSIGMAVIQSSLNKRALTPAMA